MRKTKRFFSGIMLAVLVTSLMLGDNCRTVRAATDETTASEVTADETIESGAVIEEEEEEDIPLYEVVYSTEGSCGKNATYKYDASTKKFPEKAGIDWN